MPGNSLKDDLLDGFRPGIHNDSILTGIVNDVEVEDSDTTITSLRRNCAHLF